VETCTTSFGAKATDTNCGFFPRRYQSTAAGSRESGALWQRFLAAGEGLAEQLAVFCGVVAFLEALADDDRSRELVLAFFESQIAYMTTREVADALCQAEPRLAELEGALDTAVERMSSGERHQAVLWALYEMRGHEPTLPGSVSQLLAMLHEPLEPTP
jgi:hypothetical protein